ncbi:MAG: efflux RND transporter permease subunit [Bacteroidales bacterium]
MLNKIIQFSVRQKFVALGLVLLMAVAGVSSFLNIPINSLPDVTPKQVLIITKAGRYSPYDVEKLVSYPIETSMNGLPDIKEVRSISQFGLSAVTVEFDEGTDIYFARQMVSQRLQSIREELPQGVSSPNLGPISTAMGEIYQYVVKGDNYSLTELREIQDWMIAPQLKTVKGVTEINSFGGFVKQYDVSIKPGKLRNYGLGLQDVISAIKNNNSVSGGNFLEHNREQYIIRGFGQISKKDDIGNIIVKNIEDKPVYIKDIASINLGKQIRQGSVTKDGKGEVVTGIVMMLRGGNGRDVINRMEERIENVNKSLPEGVEIEKFYDQSDLIERTTSTISTNLIEGGLLVIVILLLLLGEITGAIIVAFVIPLSMLFAFIGMEQFGLAANLMSLGAIDFGMVVDGSVVMVENIVHKLRLKGKSENTNKTIIKAGQQVARPIFFGVLIILMVYIPVVTFSGMEGILYRPMAITVAAAVFGSLLLALIFIPAISALVFRKGVKVRKNFIIDYLKPKYHRFLGRSLEKRRLILGVAATIFAFSMFVMSRLGTEFLPELEEGSILIEQVRMPSVTLEESTENANWLAGKLLKEIPEIKTVVPKTGRSDLANDWMGVHQTDIWVILKEPDKWRDGINKQDIINEIEPYLKTEPGLSYNFTQPIAMRVDELTSGVKSDMAVKIFGEDLDKMQEAGERITSIVQNMEGTDNAYLEQPIGQPYLNLEIDREAVASYGLNVDDVQTVIEAGIGGEVASEVFEGQRRFDILVRYPEDLRDDFEKIRNIPVQLPNNDFIPLSRVTNVVPEEGSREIQREDGWRRLILGINIEDIDMGTFVSKLKSEIDQNADLPPGIFLEYGGTFENQQRAMNHLLLVVPLSLFIILGLLYLNFGHMRFAFLIILNIPFALSGGVFFLAMRGMYLSVAASIGFVALFGVAVLNDIVMVSHINELRKQGEDIKNSVIDGAADRLRPVLMTALVASLGFIPMAFNTGPGSEVQRPLATVVIGGLITSTLLTMFVLPTIYHWMEKRRDKKQAQKQTELSED